MSNPARSLTAERVVSAVPVPVNANVHNIEMIFVEEHDPDVNPLKVKGLGNLGIVGTAEAIANAVFHATGKRIRELPITLDKVLGDCVHGDQHNPCLLVMCSPLR